MWCILGASMSSMPVHRSRSLLATWIGILRIRREHWFVTVCCELGNLALSHYRCDSLSSESIFGQKDRTTNSKAWLQCCRCVFQKADKEGILGVTLNKDIVKVAAKALEQNLTRLGPQVLPYREQILFAYDFALRKTGYRSSKPYQPKFRKAFDHFCLHAGMPCWVCLSGLTILTRMWCKVLKLSWRILTLYKAFRLGLKYSEVQAMGRSIS